MFGEWTQILKTQMKRSLKNNMVKKKTKKKATSKPKPPSKPKATTSTQFAAPKSAYVDIAFNKKLTEGIINLINLNIKFVQNQIKEVKAEQKLIIKLNKLILKGNKDVESDAKALLNGLLGTNDKVIEATIKQLNENLINIKAQKEVVKSFIKKSNTLVGATCKV